jgi:hypothetical protein
LDAVAVNAEFKVAGCSPLRSLDLQPALIDHAHERLVEAIADGTLAPGQRILQEELGRMLGVSRQPISHACNCSVMIAAGGRP